MARRWQRLPVDLRREVIRLGAQGATYREIREQLAVSDGVVQRVLVPLGGVARPEMWSPSPARLSIDDRVEIKLGLERGESMRVIAARIGRAASTVCRELRANGGAGRYRPMEAHRAAGHRARRPKPTKLASNPQLCERVVAELQCLRSPQQIAGRLRAEFGHDRQMRISHETIYKSLYVQGRGELRRELAQCLRTGRAARRHQGRPERRGSIPDMVMISERPAEVADRAVPGHWEGDLILGKAGRSAIGTLVERATRFVMLLHLPDGRTAEHVRVAMTDAIRTLPEQLRLSVTWDQGTEMSQHLQFKVDTGVQIYFCDPHSPWQRGSNENTNGLLRQYFPKGTDLSVHGPAELQAAADSLNSRPRQTLEFMTPSERLAELVASTG